MNMTEYLSEEMVMVGLEPEGKTDILEQMVDRLVEKGRLPADRRDPLVKKLLDREELSSTGIGGGVAIPHASGEAIDKMIVAVAQIPGGVEFDSLDNKPAQIIFMIIGSDQSPRTHLQLLAMIVRVCKRRDLVEGMIKADSAAAIYKLACASEG
jgi:mannitol/fructose-specific phosphotransferase system IIA component (Ntr-type)